ncbi:MAG: DUF6011 domain-containing protein [Bacteroidia bacterium]|nr:DUF6011 domain-containing protein [Bacteroidia bacterium]
MKGSATCNRCGKPLKDPVSIEAGLGPICRIRNKVDIKNNRQTNLFSHRAKYTWGIDEDILWLKESPDNLGRSLTNDIENCLLELTHELPDQLHKFTIIYRDSNDTWDMLRFFYKAYDMDRALEWLKYDTDQGKPHFTQAIEVDFISLNTKEFEQAKQKARRVN